ncbi:MAG: hypothetical protein EPO11_06845 [Gammaproteobacteria bacterium]|nr:MAG: hypothetical protein EPO11_06845 [Gammaproteobacteria bacterium]
MKNKEGVSMLSAEFKQSTIESQVQTDPWPFILAALNLDVYKADDRPALPDGWVEFSNSSNEATGYSGACYINTTHMLDYDPNTGYGYISVVFAHCGTNETTDLSDDINIMKDQTLSQYPYALDFVSQTMDFLIKEYANISTAVYFYQTGFSQGAVLADLVTATIQRYPQPCMFDIEGYLCSHTIENPGSKLIIQEMIDQGELPTDALSYLTGNKNIAELYFSDVNLINTCNEQINQDRYLIAPTYTYEEGGGPTFPVEVYYGDNVYYGDSYTAQNQHNLKSIYNRLKSNCEYIGISAYPFGFQNGYVAYLDGEKRKKYWDGYAQKVWEKYPTLQELFASDYDAYYADFYKYLKRVQTEAASLITVQEQPIPIANYSEPSSAPNEEISLAVDDIDLDCSPFSFDVYYANGSNEGPSLPEGWERYAYCDDISTGYYGVCYKHLESDGSYSIVFAHRGTEKTSPVDLYNDWEVFKSSVPDQYQSAQRFVYDAIDLLKVTYNGATFRFYQTGHSLGGILADLVGADLKQPSSTYENPGSKTIIQNMINQGTLPSDSLDYASSAFYPHQSDSNIVNTCHEQASKYIWRVVKEPYHYDVTPHPGYPIPKYVVDNYYYMKGYSIQDRHSIENMYLYIQSGGSMSVTTTQIVGAQNGYIAYLNPNRTDYWDGYAQYVWDNNPQLRDKLSNNYEVYLSKFYKDLDHVYQEAQTIQKEQVVTREEMSMLPKKQLERVGVSQFGLFNQQNVNVSSKELTDSFIFIEKEESKTISNNNVSVNFEEKPLQASAMNKFGFLGKNNANRKVETIEDIIEDFSMVEKKPSGCCII